MPATTRNTPAPPTAKQLAYLRTLANRTGQTFVTPTSKAAAHREIDRLTRQNASPRWERALERADISRILAERPDEAARVRDEEIVGYAASATWA